MREFWPQKNNYKLKKNLCPKISSFLKWKQRGSSSAGIIYQNQKKITVSHQNIIAFQWIHHLKKSPALCFSFTTIFL